MSYLRGVTGYFFSNEPVRHSSRRAFRNMRELDEDEASSSVAKRVIPQEPKEPAREYEVRCKKGHLRHIRLLGNSPFAKGAIKQCWAAELHGGKDPDKVKDKVFLEGVGTSPMPQEIENNVYFSRNLRLTASKIGRKELFMKYEAISEPGTEKAEWLMAVKASGGTLRDQLENNPRAVDSMKIIRDLLLAGSIMERCGYVHRDLKLDNIFMHEESPVIGDFDKMTNEDFVDGFQGAINYIPPELIMHVIDSNKAYSPRVKKQDSFAMGIIMLELLMKKPVGDNFLEKNLYGEDYPPTVDMTKIQEEVSKLQKSNPSLVIEVLKGLLEYDPANRLTLTEAHKMLRP